MSTIRPDEIRVMTSLAILGAARCDHGRMSNHRDVHKHPNDDACHAYLVCHVCHVHYDCHS